MKKASLIISFYNRVDQIELIFAALEKQSEQDFEVIVSDDGSDEKSVQQLNELILKTNLMVHHVWHPDNGFNKTKILNKAILKSRSPYLIFIDGDCLPEKHFIEDHLRLSQENQILAGRRVELSDAFSKKIDLEYIQSRKYNWLSFRAQLSGIFGKVKKAEKGIRFDLGLLNRKIGKRNKGLLGCNMSLFKSDLLSINGFDERYNAPGVGEDTDIYHRAKNQGLTVVQPLFSLVQFHLYHPKNNVGRFDKNNEILKGTIANRYSKTPYGIEKLSK